MQESLLNLFQLQQIDQGLFELEKLKSDIPQKIEALDKQNAEAERLLTEKESQLEELEKLHRQHEREVEASQEQIQKYQGQLLSVKTNKEYDALQHEIQAQKAQINEREDVILELMAQIESNTEEIEQMRTDVASQKERITEEIAELKKRLGTVDEDVLVKNDERLRMQDRIEYRILKTYDRLKKGRSQKVVVPIKKGACGGCFHLIPLQRVAEVRQGLHLVTCETCGRILVMEPEV